MTADLNPFAEYHRRRWIVHVTRLASLALSIAVTIGLVSLVEPAAPSSSSNGGVTPELDASLQVDPVEVIDLPSPPADADVAAEAAAAAVEAPTTPAPAPSLPTTGSASRSISIDTRGYQDEIDECLWVRMDLGGEAPIVGAHNYCGGDVVLDMEPGDRVTLAGTGLDGAYVVSDERDARAGDIAANAIAGMVAEVVLQTCYWGRTGSVRLVGLTPAPAP